MFFVEEGYDVVAVGGGAEALRELEAERPPDVLLADAVMPGPDGYELCERVKRDARLGGVPVVLLVGTFEPFNQAEARRVGADTVLTKPFQSIRDLVSRVGSLLGGGEAKHEEEAREQSHAEEAEHATLHADAHAQEPFGTNGHAPGGHEAHTTSSEAQPPSFESHAPSHEAEPATSFEA